MVVGRCVDLTFGGVYGMTSRIANAFGWYFALGMISIYAFSQGIGQQLLKRAQLLLDLARCSYATPFPCACAPRYAAADSGTAAAAAPPTPPAAPW